MSKKALSPLFSTIILIGFAVALGGVVMNWGKTGYGLEQQTQDCQKASLSLISYSEDMQICAFNNKIYFTIENNGEVALSGVRVNVLGENGIYSTDVGIRINVAEILKSDISFENTGKIKKVIFVPKFILAGQDKLCPKNGFSVEDIKEC